MSSPMNISISSFSPVSAQTIIQQRLNFLGHSGGSTDIVANLKIKRNSAFLVTRVTTDYTIYTVHLILSSKAATPKLHAKKKYFRKIQTLDEPITDQGSSREIITHKRPTPPVPGTFATSDRTCRSIQTPVSSVIPASSLLRLDGCRQMRSRPKTELQKTPSLMILQSNHSVTLIIAPSLRRSALQTLRMCLSVQEQGSGTASQDRVERVP
jgi:hypothetical protein